MNTGTKMTLGILGGIGAGFCLGLLMAPDKGSNSRKKIAKTANGWADKLVHTFSHDGHDHQENSGRSATGSKSERVKRGERPGKKS